MDCRFEDRVKELIAQLARERQAELAEAGTLLDLETLAVQIGDMVSRELTQMEVARRADALDEAEARCPDCGRMCPRGEREPVILNGLRGELTYSQPKYDCRHCRRSFFPGGRYQRRDYFGEKNRPPGRKHWREDKVGCLLSMTGPSYESDPVPKLPEWLKVSSAIQ